MQQDLNPTQILTRLPKAEPHAHFEGSVSPTLLGDLAREYQVDLFAPARAPIGAMFFRPDVIDRFLDGSFVFADFQDFIAIYLKITECIATSGAVRQVGEHYIDQAKADGIVAADLYFTPGTFSMFGRNVPSFFEALAEVSRAARHDANLQLQWIFDIVRNLSEDGLEIFPYFDLAKNRGLTVRYLGLAGDESVRGAAPFARAFDEARKRKLIPLAHSGESGSSKDMLETISLLRPQRIGHGIRALEDPELTEKLLRTQLPLEVSPWSNILLGFKTAANHPMAAMIRAGLNVLPASDDPGIFGKSLTDNYLFAFGQGITLDELQIIAAKSIRLIVPDGN